MKRARARRPPTSADTVDKADNETKVVNLALQGGGSHGAFTWGVLDALLEDGRLQIEAVTGASAGAIKAVLVFRGSWGFETRTQTTSPIMATRPDQALMSISVGML